MRQPGVAFRRNGGAAALLRDRSVPRDAWLVPHGDTVASTPWWPTPAYTAHCMSAGGANWLQVDTTNIAGDQRPVVSAAPRPHGGCTSTT